MAHELEVRPLGPLPQTPAIRDVPTSMTQFMAELLDRDQLKRQRLSVIDTSQNVLDVRLEADKSAVFDLDRAKRGAEQFNKVGDRALNRLDTMDQIPNIVNQIMGMFDPDFNESIQRRNLTRAQLGLSRIQTNLVRSEQRRQLLINSAQAEKKQSLELLQITRQGILDDINLKKFGFEVEQNIRKETVQFAQDQTIGELQKFLRNPETAPGELRGKPGLIKTVLTIKQSAEAGLDAQTFSLSVQKQARDLRDFKSSFNSIEEVDNFDGVFPPGASKLTLLELKEAFVRADTSLQTMRLALNAKKTAIFNAAKKTFFGTQTAVDLRGMRASAKKNNGQFDAGEGVSFSQREIQTELAAAVEREQKEMVTLDQETLAVSQLSGNLEVNNLIDEQFAGIYDTSATPSIDAIPIDVYQQLLNTDATISIMQQQVRDAIIDGDGTASARIQRLNEQLGIKAKLYRDQVDERAENDFSDGARPAFREWALTKQVSPINGTALIMDIGGNRAAFIDNNIMDAPWEKFAEEFATASAERLTNIAPGAGGTGITALSGRQRDSVILNNVVEATKFRNLVTANAQIAAMALAVSQLAEEFGAPPSVSADAPSNIQVQQVNVFSRLRDVRTGLLAPRFSNAEGKFDFGIFLQETAQQTLELQKAGVLQAGETIAGLVFDRARASVSVVMDKAFSGLYGKSVESAVFGKSARSMVQTSIDAASSMVAPSVANAEALRAEKETIIRQELELSRQREDFDPATSNLLPAEIVDQFRQGRQ